MSTPPPTWSGDPRVAAVLDREIVRAGVANWAAASIWRGDSTLEGAVSPIATPPVFDLASLTKPLTATVALHHVSEGRLSLDTTVAGLLPALEGSPAERATVESLLAHRAGLPAWGALYRLDPFAHTPACSVPLKEVWPLATLVARAASSVEAKGRERYSDLGYVLLGAMLRAFGPLTEQWRVLTGIGGAPSAASHAWVAPTEEIAWRGGIVRGRVHDENAFALEEAGGDPGHAGAFGTASEVSAFGRAWLEALSGRSVFFDECLARRAIEHPAEGTHALGWDLRSGSTPSSGQRFGPRTFGHLGFTGTSLWIDPDQQLVVALLTNRVHPTRANDRIRAARPRVHDALVALLD